MTDGAVNMWYDIHVVGVNQKRYVENADPFIYVNFMSKKKCSDAALKAQFTWRRNENLVRQKIGASQASLPDRFTQLVERVPDDDIRPCGLQSIAMFTDEYELYRIEDGVKIRVPLDESNIAIEQDEDIYEGKIIPHKTGNYSGFEIDGKLSWLAESPFIDHFKVWMRSPPTTNVRHLWAVVKDGLPRGTYRLQFPQNSAIWTASADIQGWNSNDKKIIFSTQHPLGSKGACVFFGAICLVFATLEIFAFLGFLVMPKPRTQDSKSSGLINQL
jgi:hypothetical protein